MAKRLIDAGFDLSIWNRSPEKMRRFQQQAELAISPSAAITDADIVISMLENGDIVDLVLFKNETYKKMKPGALYIDMSSIPPTTARKHAQLIEQHGAFYLDAPVSGGTTGATEGTLSIMVGGPQNLLQRAQPIFNCLGSAIRVGDVGCGQLCKLANQAIVGITIGAVAEALLLATKGGADPEAVHKALSGGFASSRVLELHGKRMLNRDFTPGATSRVQLKDLKTILDEARHEELSLPLSQRTYESYLSLVANGNEHVDHSGLLLELEHLNNTQLKSIVDNA